MKKINSIELLSQFVFWVLLLAVSLSLSSQLFPIGTALGLSLKNLLIWACIAYVNIHFLIPRFFKKERFGWYISCIFLLSAWAVSMMELGTNVFFDGLISDVSLLQNRKPPTLRMPSRQIRLVPLFFISLAILFISTVYQLAKEFMKKERQSNLLEKEKIAHELNFLRSQINPHFLFNALNNLHATVQLKPEKAGDYILKLGEMLRYVLEDCKKEKVSLADEINYLENYIYFQKQKDEKFQHIHFEVNAENPANFYLEPMLLITLVENAFEHSHLENIEHQWVDIALTTNDQTLLLEVKNNLSSFGTEGKDSLGIGLKNIIRRLELLYSGRFELTYEKKDTYFLAILAIRL